MTDVPWPTTEWDQIIPGLYQGGHVFQVGDYQFITKLKGVSAFDMVVDLYTMSDPDTHPDPGVEHFVHQFYDDKVWGLTRSELTVLKDLTNVLAYRINTGKKVLVRCQAGYNRSGIVCALTLVRLGMQPQAAINLLREKRSPWVLHNKRFEEDVLAQVPPPFPEKCIECTIDDDPSPWCDCQRGIDETGCKSVACKLRAHDPEHCPTPGRWK